MRKATKNNHPVHVAKKKYLERIPRLMQQHETPRKGYSIILLFYIQAVVLKQKLNKKMWLI